MERKNETLGIDKKSGKWVDIWDLTPETNVLGYYAVHIFDRELDGKMVQSYQIVEHFADSNLFATNVPFECSEDELIEKHIEFDEKLTDMGFPPFFGKGNNR